MKIGHRKFSDHYLAALRTSLAPRKSPQRTRAAALGRMAVAGGLTTLDLAKVHEKAVLTLAKTHDFTARLSRALPRANNFFADSLAPIEGEQRRIRETNRQLARRVETLRRHTAALARGQAQLQREVARRRAAETRIIVAKERYRTLFWQSEGMQSKLRTLTRQILSAQEEERKKISRELHDEVVQTLVGINVELTALSKGAAAGVVTLKRKIARTRRLVEKSVSAVHRFARELRPAVLDDIGLIPALHAYSKTLAERHKLPIKMTAYAGVEALSMAKRTVLFRVAQEALNNVVRHAGATLVLIGITKQAGAIHMQIHDNGKSFAVAETLSAKNNRRLGLIGMRERIEMIGGRLAIESASGSGTIVRAEIPFTSKLTPFL